MPTINQIKTQISSVKSLQKIIKALEIVSTIKLQKLKSRNDFFKGFMMDFLKILKVISQEVNIFDFDYKNWDPNWKRLLIVVTSDKWLCWSLNSSLLKHIDQKYNNEKFKNNVDIFAIWKKWLDFFVRWGWNIVGSIQPPDNFEENNLQAVCAYVKKSLRQNDYSKIKIYFNYFKNTTSQVPLRFKLYPLDEESFNSYVQDLDLQIDNMDYPKNKEMIIEPKLDRFKHKIIQEMVEYIIYGALLNNKTWEHAARMLAMKNASDNSTTIIKNLKTYYNKTRQAKITQEIAEIVSAKTAIENN